MTPQQRASRRKFSRDVDSETDFGYFPPPKGKTKKTLKRVCETVRKRLDILEAQEQATPEHETENS